MKVVCRKEFKNMKVGQITTFTPRENLDVQSFQSIGRAYRDSYDSPIGCVYLNDEFLSVNSIKPEFISCFVIFDDFRDHFCTIKEYRKLKLKLNKINVQSKV